MRNNRAKRLIVQWPSWQKAFACRTIAGWIADGDFNTNHDAGSRFASWSQK